jgi:hypothetical protein
VISILPTQFMMASSARQAPPPISTEERSLLEQLGQQCQQVLGEHGLGREVVGGGGILPPRFEAMGLSDDSKVAIFKLDVSRPSLPGKGAIHKAASKPVLSDLSGLTGYPWVAVNHTGITYLVWLAQSQRKPLPGIASLDWTARPKDITYPVPIGVSNTGDHVWMSLFDTSHVLVGGESRSGKSTWAHAMLCGMLPFCTPDTLTLALLDAKGVEFSMWKHVPHLVAPICKRADQADVLLTSTAAEMDRREVLFDQVMARDLQGYNSSAKLLGHPTLPVTMILIDEVTDFMVQRPDLAKSLTHSLVRLASKGAAFGIFLIIVTQNPKAKVIDTLIRGNLSTRLAFRVASPEHSRTILGSNVNGRGAHQLPRSRRGRFMARLDGDLVEMQGYYVDDDLIRKVTKGIVGQGWPRAAQIDCVDPGTHAAEAETIVQSIDEVGRLLSDIEPIPEEDLELSEVEWRVLRVAIDEMEGDLSVNPLYGKLKEAGIGCSHRQLRGLIERLIVSGWVAEQRSSNDPRRCTDALIEAVAAYFGE